MASTPCPHGLPPRTCEICRVMGPPPVLDARRLARRPARLGGVPGGVLTVAVVAIVAFVVLGWAAAAFFAVLRILELVAVAAIAGWVGWKLGVARGRRSV
ncbi:MAG: hypothetical protein M3203_12190 [Actinomycetota bacterium]|nr:hypothetical protein [Actinomycetota bacterium]